MDRSFSCERDIPEDSDNPGWGLSRIGENESKGLLIGSELVRKRWKPDLFRVNEKEVGFGEGTLTYR